jgi:hypothetical protein
MSKYQSELKIGFGLCQSPGLTLVQIQIFEFTWVYTNKIRCGKYTLKIASEIFDKI